jgi:hypothetical protein
MFVNWQVPDERIEQCDLLDGTDFSGCRIIFFDPLEFAVKHGLRSNQHDISEAEYIACSEDAFMRYLAGIKAVSRHIKTVLENRGILVLRSQIPNSQFKIRKKSSIGTQSYTESVVSPFFWLEEYLGKYSFNYCSLKTIRFLVRNHPLRKAFGGSAVNLLQTQTKIGEENVEVIAAGGLAFKSPAISRITFDSMPGQIYLIPQFIVKQEHLHLMDSFRRIAERKALGIDNPKWLDEYEVQLEGLNPFRSELDKLDREINTLEGRKQEILEKMEATMRLVDLLVETGLGLASAARTGMDTLGFECSQVGISEDGHTFDVLLKGKDARRAVIRAASADSGPIPVSEIEKLAETIESRKLKVKPKGILIGNASRLAPPTERDEWFDPECLDLARRHDFCLFPAFEMYTAVCNVLHRYQSKHIEEIKLSLRRDIIECDTFLVLNRKKYGL